MFLPFFYIFFSEIDSFDKLSLFHLSRKFFKKEPSFRIVVVEYIVYGSKSQQNEQINEGIETQTLAMKLKLTLSDDYIYFKYLDLNFLTFLQTQFFKRWPMEMKQRIITVIKPINLELDDLWWCSIFFLFF